AAGGSAPELAVVVEVRKNRVGACRLHHRKQPFQYCVDGPRGMSDIEIDGVERLAQMPLGIVIEAAAVEALVAVGDGPFDDVVKNAIIKIKIEGDGIIESHIFVTDRVTLHCAKAEGDDVVVLSPDEEADLVRHPSPGLAKEALGEFLELQR